MLAVQHDAPLIKRCRQETLLQAVAMIERCLEAARESLDNAARDSHSIAARQGLQDALDALDQRRTAIKSSFPAMLDQTIADAIDNAGNKVAEHEREFDALPSEMELALLDDSELSQFVESSRLVQVVQPVVERMLARFDSLMSSVLDQPVVRPDLNPLRPEVLCRALMRLLDQQSDSTEVRRLWLRHLAKSYSKELNGLYMTLGDLLEHEGIQEARYHVKLTESGARPVVMVVSAAAPMIDGLPGRYQGSRVPSMPGAFHNDMAEPAGDPTLGGELSDEQAIRRRRAPMPRISDLANAHVMVPRVVMREFFYDPQSAQNYDMPLPPDYYVAVQQQLAQVAVQRTPCYDEAARLNEQARMRALAVVDRPARAVTLEMPLSPQQWGQQAASPQARELAVMELKAKASKVSHALGIDAVRALVAQIAGDERILAPVREAMVALEPALLRLTLIDPHFFGDGNHPARRFIEEVAQRSFKYNDEFSPEFAAFIEPVRQMVRELDTLTELSDQNFDRSLKLLQSDWQTRDQAEKEARERGQSSMEFVQKRQELADKIAWDFSLRSDLEGVPSAVVSFLFKDWSLVIAYAQLTDSRGRLDPGGYLSIVTDLLWSVKRDQILRNPAKLFDIAPRIVTTLRKGLEMLGKELHESQALFDMLLRLHEPVLKLRRLRSAMNQGAVSQELVEKLELRDEDWIKPGQSPKPQAGEQPWIGQREQEAAGFMDGEENKLETISLARLAFEGEAALDDRSLSVAENALQLNGQRAVFAPTRILDGKPQIMAAAAPATVAASSSAPAQAPQGQQEAPPVDAETTVRVKAQLAQLRRGDWVDLRSRKKWWRAELVWVNNNGALYMFVGHGGQACSMTRSTLEELLRLRHLRPVDSSAVVDRALKAIAAGAGRESTAARAD